MVYTLRFPPPPSKCSLFHNSNVFGSCFIHILYTGYAKIKKNNSGAKRLKKSRATHGCVTLQRTVRKRGANVWTGLNWFRARLDGEIL